MPRASSPSALRHSPVRRRSDRFCLTSLSAWCFLFPDSFSPCLLFHCFIHQHVNLIHDCARTLNCFRFLRCYPIGLRLLVVRFSRPLYDLFRRQEPHRCAVIAQIRYLRVKAAVHDRAQGAVGGTSGTLNGGLMSWERLSQVFLFITKR